MPGISPIPGLPGIPVPGLPNPGDVLGDILGKGDDVLAKDERVHLSKLLADNGWGTGEEAKIAAAVVMGESGGNPNVVNSIKCVGLFQLNVPVHKGTRGMPADEEKAIEWAKDPVNNVRFARSLYESKGWAPWDAYKNGSYRKFLGQDPLITVSHNSLTDPISGAVNAVTSIPDTIAKIVGALFDPSTYLRVGKGALGGVFIIVGVGAAVFIIANKVANSDVGQGAMAVGTRGASKLAKGAKGASATAGEAAAAV